MCLFVCRRPHTHTLYCTYNNNRIHNKHKRFIQLKKKKRKEKSNPAPNPRERRLLQTHNPPSYKPARGRQTFPFISLVTFLKTLKKNIKKTKQKLLHNTQFPRAINNHTCASLGTVFGDAIFPPDSHTDSSYSPPGS